MPRPAPRAITRVCSTPIAELKNAIDSPPCECRGTSPEDGNRICLRIPGNKKTLVLHVHLQEKGSRIARTLDISAWLCKNHILFKRTTNWNCRNQFFFFVPDGPFVMRFLVIVDLYLSFEISRNRFSFSFDRICPRTLLLKIFAKSSIVQPT